MMLPPTKKSKQPDPEIITLLYAALDAELGVIVKTNKPASLKQKIYQTRKLIDAPELDQISCVESVTDPEGSLWLVKK